MVLDGVFNYRQAKPRAAGLLGMALVHAVEPLENAALILRRDAYPRVAHGQLRVFAVGRYIDACLLYTSIALIGDNGTGKSTLVKLIMGDETPDAGYVYRGPAVRTAYLPQMVSFSVPERSAYDTMLYDCRCQPQEARDRLAAFGFRGEDAVSYTHLPDERRRGGEHGASGGSRKLSANPY